MGEAAASHNCGTVTLIEKTSMELLPHTGLITDQKVQKDYLERFSAGLKSSVNYQVYVSDRHGSGVGHYEIGKTTLDGRKVSLQLDFMISLFEKGATVMNQRILFLQSKPGCEITEVVSSYPQNDKDKKK